MVRWWPRKRACSCVCVWCALPCATRSPPLCGMRAWCDRSPVHLSQTKRSHTLDCLVSTHLCVSQPLSAPMLLSLTTLSVECPALSRGLAMSFNSDSLTHLGFDKQYVQHTPAAIDRNYIPVSAYDERGAVVIASRRRPVGNSIKNAAHRANRRTNLCICVWYINSRD